jgi:ketosteroid isomerase-like protein
VKARLTRLENVSTVINGTIAMTADYEHMIRSLDGREYERTLRVTQGYRFEDGRWRIFYRHGDEYRPSGR